MRGTGEYFSGVGAAPLEVPPALRARAARRSYFNHCMATHRPSPTLESKCQARAADWARQQGLTGIGEYFSGVGDVVISTDDGSWKKPWFFGLFVGALVGYSFAHLTMK